MGGVYTFDNVISVVTRLRAKRSRVRIPARARDFSVSELPHLFWGPLSLLFSRFHKIGDLGQRLEVWGEIQIETASGCQKPTAFALKKESDVSEITLFVYVFVHCVQLLERLYLV